MNKILAALTLCLALLNDCHALEPDDLITGAAIGSLGGAYAGLAEGSQSLFINPGGLAAIETDHIYSGLGVHYALPLSQYHFAYVHPLYAGIATAGGWQSIRYNLKATDRFYLSWSQQELLPWIPKSDHRFSWGLSFNAVNKVERTSLTENFKNKFGIGIDAGALLKFLRTNTQFGMSIIAADTINTDNSGPIFTLGAMQQWRPYSFLLDLRIRPNFTSLYPAAQKEIFHGLAIIRAGLGGIRIKKGALRLSQDGGFTIPKTLSLGFGANLSPLSVDMAIDLPYEGIQSLDGAAMVSVGYAFGGINYHEKFIGRAAGEAQRLSKEILTLEAKQKLVQKDLKDTEFNLKVLGEEIKAMEARRREDLAGTELRRAEAERRHEESTSKLKPAPKPQWPKRHRVSEGDTLRGVAGQYYGDPELWEIIYKANPAKIVRGLPKVGEILEIPNPEKGK